MFPPKISQNVFLHLYYNIAKGIFQFSLFPGICNHVNIECVIDIELCAVNKRANERLSWPNVCIFAKSSLILLSIHAIMNPGFMERNRLYD